MQHADDDTRVRTSLPLGPERFDAPAEESKTLRFELSRRSLFIVFSIIAGVWLLVHLLSVVMVLVMALMIAGALSPLVTWLEQRKVRRIFALCLVFGIGVALTATLTMLTVPTVVAQFKTVAEHEGEYRETVASYLEQSSLTAKLADELRDIHYTELLKSFKATLLSMGVGVFAILAYCIAAIFLAFYIMLDRDRLRGALFAIVPRAHHIRLSHILLNLETIVGSYIRGQLLTCVMMGAFLFVLLLACRVPNALAIAVFGGVMDLLPYIGIFLTMGPAVLAASANGPVIAGIVFAMILAYEELESRLLVPLVYGRTLRLPSSVVFFSLLVGTALAGIAGALLALPLAAAILMLIEELRLELPGESIQAKDIVQREEDHRAEKEYERRAESLPAKEAAAVAVKIAHESKTEIREDEKSTAKTGEEERLPAASA